MKKYILFLSPVILLIGACKKEKITITKEVPVVHSWSLDSSVFGASKILSASLPLNDSILAVANRSLIWYINVNKLNKSIEGIVIPGIPQLYDVTLPPTMTRSISVSLLDPNRLEIYATVNPVFPYGMTTFSPTYSGSATSVKGISFPVTYAGSGYPVIRSKYILTPTELDIAAKKAFFSLIKVDTTRIVPQSPAVSFVSSNNIVLTPSPSTLGFTDGGYFSAAFYDKFFVSYYNQFFRVDTLGNVKAFGYSPAGGDAAPVNNMFLLNNYLFGLGNGQFFVSQDQGETWSLFLDARSSPYGNLKYTNVGNDLYAIHGSQLWKVTMAGNTLVFTELDNDGLETNQITSINKCGKYALVTTLSGLYYRDTASLNTTKK